MVMKEATLRVRGHAGGVRDEMVVTGEVTFPGRGHATGERPRP